MDNQNNILDSMQNSIDLKKPIGIGANLKAAREAMHLSEKEAATKLHLSPRFIEVMENEDFENGPPFTFMRGYLRAYARILNFPMQEVDSAIEQLNMSYQPKTNTATPTRWEPTGISIDLDPYIRWMTYLIFFTLIVLVGIWWNSRSSETPEIINKPTSATSTQPIATTPDESISAPAAPVENAAQPVPRPPVPVMSTQPPAPVAPATNNMDNQPAVPYPSQQPPTATPQNTGTVTTPPPYYQADMQAQPQATAPGNVPNPPNVGNPPNIPNAPNPANIPNSPNLPTSSGMPMLPPAINPTGYINPSATEALKSNQPAKRVHKHKRRRHIHRWMAVPEPGLYQ